MIIVSEIKCTPNKDKNLADVIKVEIYGKLRLDI